MIAITKWPTEKLVIIIINVLLGIAITSHSMKPHKVATHYRTQKYGKGFLEIKMLNTDIVKYIWGWQSDGLTYVVPQVIDSGPHLERCFEIVFIAVCSAEAQSATCYVAHTP